MDEFIYVDAPYNKIYDTYIDEHEIVEIVEKEVLPGAIGRIVQGDSNSQFMTFKIKRYYDNIDLSDKLIKFIFIYRIKGKILPSKTPIYSNDACNICYNDEEVRFSWLLPEDFCETSGTIAACISFIGQDPNEHYQLKTTVFDLTIESSIDNKELIEAAGKSWFEDMEARVYKVEQATGQVDLDYNSLRNKPTLNGQRIEGDMEIEFVKQANDTRLGGVKAMPKVASQTQIVGIDQNGFLWTTPGGGGGTGGQDGFSPLVSMVTDDNGTLLNIIDKDGLKSAYIKNGTNGTDGVDGKDGKDGIDGENGTDGKNGEDGIDGISPIVSMTTVENGTKIIITDKDGAKEAIIPNGKDGKDGVDGTPGKDGEPGQDGKDGAPGQDGTSVTAAIDDTVEGQHTVTLTDKDGDKSFTIKDGTDGEDGTSVAVKVEDVEGGHKITFTDKDGEKSFTILDGSAVKISEEDGNIIEDNNGLYATVDEDAITENVKKALGDLYLALTGGTVKGVVNISVPNKVNNLFTVKRGTHDNTILASFDGGHVITGSDKQTGYCALGSMRKCASDNDRINSAAFYCNADGTAIFTHKGGAIGVTGVQNDAWMKFNQNGFLVSYSGEYNKSATEVYTLLDSHNVGDDATIKALEARIKALEDKG